MTKDTAPNMGEATTAAVARHLEQARLDHENESAKQLFAQYLAGNNARATEITHAHRNIRNSARTIALSTLAMGDQDEINRLAQGLQIGQMAGLMTYGHASRLAGERAEISGGLEYHIIFNIAAYDATASIIGEIADTFDIPAPIVEAFLSQLSCAILDMPTHFLAEEQEPGTKPEPADNNEDAWLAVVRNTSEARQATKAGNYIPLGIYLQDNYRVKFGSSCTLDPVQILELARTNDIDALSDSEFVELTVCSMRLGEACSGTSAPIKPQYGEDLQD